MFSTINLSAAPIAQFTDVQTDSGAFMLTTESLGGRKFIHFAYFVPCDDSQLEEKQVAEDGLRQLKPMKIETDDPLYSFHTV